MEASGGPAGKERRGVGGAASVRRAGEGDADRRAPTPLMPE